MQAEPITELFNRMLVDDNSAEWRKAKVVPLYEMVDPNGGARIDR